MTTKKNKRNFRKLSNVEHVRIRTGMWLGQNSMSVYTQHFFVPDKKGENYTIKHDEIEDIPAKLKCLDEACMNCVDEYIRNQNDKAIPKSKKMNNLTIVLSNDRKRVTIADNGRGIPVKNAEGVFLHLMYGENFDDKLKEDHIAGQNGVGISLVRIVSSYFMVETSNNGKSYKKLFTVADEFKTKLKDFKYSDEEISKICLHFDEHGEIETYNTINDKHRKVLKQIMKKTKMTDTITKCQPTEHGTSVTFELNNEFFNGLDVSFNKELMSQFLQDIAMTNPGLTVTFKHKGSEKKYFFKKGLEDILKLSGINHYKFTYSSERKGLQLNIQSFILEDNNRSLSWVNSNFASLGGSPFEYLENKICDEIRKKPSIIAHEKKLKTSATRNDVRNCFHFFNNWHMLNPRFKSQDKSYLINNVNEDIREAVDLNLDKLIRKLDLVNAIKGQMEKRSRIKEIDDAAKNLRKTARLKIAKLITTTGKNNEPGRTLFIAEGDSAIAGLRPARNPLKHALFPLRGKPLNVVGMPIAKAMKNEEIKNLISIIGLPLDEKVKSIDQLNYEKISIITDADFDGYAIRSLIFSFFFEYWPELFQLGFIHYSSAPLYEVDIKLDNKNSKIETIYCIDDDEYMSLEKKLKKQSGEIVRKKRNKGLGETSKAAMKYTVENCLTKVTVDDIKKARKTQKLWFHKDNAGDRRKTISEYSQLFLND